MKPFQEKLVAAWTDYAAGKIDAKTLKGQSAGFGIYQQRDDATMMRIRRPAGIVTTEDFRNAAAIMTKYGVPFAHITTRQAIQLHGVSAKDVPAALEDCEAVGFRFRGGGGDTFRNTFVNRDSGLNPDTVFDVIPYARAMSDAFYGFDTAYGLPRKIKIGFADRAADRMLAATQDLGFLAKTVDGRRCFETWFAGGIGFKPRTGIRLYDALPAEDCCTVAFALTRLFNEKGCRTNRAHARIRFLREDLGDEALVALLKEYIAAETEAPKLTEDVLSDEDLPLTTFPTGATPAAGFDLWKELAVKPLRDGLVSVRVLVPYGNFTPADFVRFADVMDGFGATRFQIVPTEDLVFAVPADQLAGVYNVLCTDLAARDYTLRSFKGHVTTCIGATVCKSGVTDSPAVGTALAEALDRYLPPDTPEKMRLAKTVLDDIRISGCPNSCTAQPVVRFGFNCRKSGGADVLVPYTPSDPSVPSIGTAEPEMIAVAELPNWLLNRLG